MKILFLVPRYHTNIIETINSHLKLGHKVEIHVKNYGYIEDYSNLKPLKFEELYFTKVLKKIFKFKTINNSFYLPQPIKYISYLKKNKFNYAFLRVHGLVYTYVISCILKICGIKIIYYQQTNLDLSFLNVNNRFINIRKIEFYFRLKIFNAKWVTPLKNNDYKYNIKKLFYLPFVVKLKKYKLNFTNLNILTIGKFVNRKNHIFFLESILDLIILKNIKITIVGELSNNDHYIYYKKLLSFVKKNKLQNNVFIKKNIDHNKIYNLYKNNNLFVLPSTNEPAAISILEAMGCGLVTICSNTCGTRTYIKNGKNGYIFKDNSKKDLRKKITFILDDMNKFKKMSDISYNFANSNLSSENYINHFENVIK
tara:strand:- start:1173 stop:2276 length:1104 start_codon:yes stop_codon:yes gene_type:complete